MKNILLLSDTHAYLDERMIRYIQEADEVWHAGDIGSLELADRISSITPLRAVYGNIDNDTTRLAFPGHLFFVCEGLSVLMVHIAGVPGKYNQEVKSLLIRHKPGILICGHSHILKVVRDEVFHHLHINPGAAGKHGFHKTRTMLRFKVNESKLSDMDVIELGAK